MSPAAIFGPALHRRFPVAVLALTLPVVLPGQPPERVLCERGFLRIVSPDAPEMSPDQCRAVANETMNAWRFDAAQKRWPDPGRFETAPLTLELLSVGRMKSEHPGLYGFARGRDLMVVSLAVLDRPFAKGTLAHEIAHIQAKRAMGRQSEKRLVPGYFIEGHGNGLGRAYRENLRIADHAYDAHMAARIVKMTPAQASAILSGDNSGSAARKDGDAVEAMGIFFVEYLRVRYRGSGIADVIPRMSRVFEAVGRGETYESAFERQFGEPVGRVVSEIIDFMRRTESAPARRLKGTLYEQFVSS